MRIFERPSKAYKSNLLASYPVFYFFIMKNSPHILASAGSDNSIRIWDLRINDAVKIIPNSHLNDVLSIDFNKYENAIASGGGDSLIKIWDLRSDKNIPLRYLPGHKFAVKRVKFSPFNKNILASSSLYFLKNLMHSDMNVLIWDILGPQPLINQFHMHTEFVNNIDFSLFNNKYFLQIIK